MRAEGAVFKNLKSRHLDMNLHTVWIDEDSGVAVFPLWNLSGQLVGYQNYRPNATKEKKNHPREGRYFTFLKDGKLGVWGLESWNLTDTLFVTEGIFDAARLTERGYSAIATLSNDPVKLKEWFWIIRQLRTVIVICDPDTAGRKLGKYGHESFLMDSEFDLGAAPEKYVDDLINALGITRKRL